MIKSIKTHTPILALVLFVFAVGYTLAANKVVVIPMAGDSMPSGMVSAFNSYSCPTGWQKYTKAQGRFIMGLTDAGGLGQIWGTHEHNHTWSYFNSINKDWDAYNIDGVRFRITDWGDGMDGAGLGHYPFSVNDAASSSYYWTSNTLHMPPSVRLLYCEKT